MSLLCYFFWKKSNQKNQKYYECPCVRRMFRCTIYFHVLTVYPPHAYLCHLTIPNHPLFCVQHYFSFILFCFAVFFTGPPWLFRHRPLVPCIFLFFRLQTQEVFLFPPGKSTIRQYSCGSRTYKFRCCNNIGIPHNGASYKI